MIGTTSTITGVKKKIYCSISTQALPSRPYCKDIKKRRHFLSNAPTPLFNSTISDTVFIFLKIPSHRMKEEWNDTDMAKPKYSGKNLAPVPDSPPQISHGMARNQTPASAVTGLPLITKRILCTSD